MISRRTLFLMVLFVLAGRGTLMAQVKVDQLRIEGNERTRESVILREWSYAAPDSVLDTTSSEYLLTFEDRLYNTNLFNKVETHLERDSGVTVLVVHLVEKWYSWPIPFVEFSDRNFNIWEDLEFELDRTNYGLYFFNYNLFGLNHSAKLSVVHGYHRKYGFEYRIPFLSPRSQTGLAVRIQHSSQDELWHRTEDDRLGFYHGEGKDLVVHDWFALHLQHQLEPQLQLFGTYAYSRMNVASDAAVNELGQPFLEGGMTRQVHHFTGVQLQRDDRNSRFFPTLGSFTSLGLESEVGDLNNVRVRFDHRYLGRREGRFGVAFGAYLEHNTNGGRAYRNSRMLGYSRYVRGYESYVVDGRSTVLFRSGLRLHVLKREFPLEFVPYLNYKFLPIRAFLEVFADGGYVQSDRVVPGNQLPNTAMYSVGLGLNALAYNDKVLRFEYALNGRSEWGWYIHFASAL